MHKIKTKIKDLFVLKGKKFFDQRGWLRESFKVKIFKKKIVFCVASKSKRNVLRGLHFQYKNEQDKIIVVLNGKF